MRYLALCCDYDEHACPSRNDRGCHHCCTGKSRRFRAPRRARHGAGVVELIDELLANDLATRAALLARHRIPLGADRAGHVLSIDPYGSGILIVGTEHHRKTSTRI